MEVVPVERPLVEGDLDGATADQHPDRDEQAQAPRLARRQTQLSIASSQKQMQLEESEGEAEAVPPEMDAADVEQDGVDPMRIRSEHVWLLCAALTVRDTQIAQQGQCQFPGES